MGRVAAVILAAGSASRFGGGKLLATIEGRPVLQHVLDRLAEAPLGSILVVLGDDAEAIRAAIELGDARVVRNPHPALGLASSLRMGVSALPAEVDAALIVLGDQPRLDPDVVGAVLAAGVDAGAPFAAPVYEADGARNPVLVHRSAFERIAALEGDRGLGPLLAERPDLVRDVPVTRVANPDIDTPDDLVAVLEAAWGERVRANAAQVDRYREVPDGTDFYAPVSSLFRADPARTDEPALDALLALVEPGETWLDIGAGAGRYALPLARRLAASGGRVLAVEPSAGMLASMRTQASEHRIDNMDIVEARWPEALHQVAARGGADVALIAHVGYDIEAIGPFIQAMEAATRRRCIALLMERQPSSIADVCWPPVWGEARIALPALPELVELLRAMGREPSVQRLEREPRRFASREELASFLRRQLWVAEGSEADRRFLAALDGIVVEDDDGRVGLRGQRPLPIGLVTWAPGTPT
jgi:molybdenum cofactor cytidylyltransferase